VFNVPTGQVWTLGQRSPQAEASVVKLDIQERSLGGSVGAVTVLLARVAKKSRRGVDARYSMTSGVEVAGNAAFATADLDGPSRRRRDELIEETLPGGTGRRCGAGSASAHPVLGVGLPFPFGAIQAKPSLVRQVAVTAAVAGHTVGIDIC
jgi:hypothetical protein